MNAKDGCGIEEGNKHGKNFQRRNASMGHAKKQLEEVNIELHMHRNLLEEQVKERTSELTASNKMLQAEITERKLASRESVSSQYPYNICL